MGVIVGVFSAKGGVGKSLLTVNLGTSLAVGTGKPTLAVDLNAGTGGLDLLLDLKSTRSWADLRDVLDEIEPRHIEQAISHHKSGLDLMACPASIEEEKHLQKGDIPKLLTALRDVYDYSIVDSKTGSGILTQALFDSVDFRLIVLTPDLPTIRATQRWLAGREDNQDRIWLVLNQYSPTAAIQAQDLDNYLGFDLLGVLPIDPAGAWNNISFGDTCVLQKRSKFGKAVRGFSSTLFSLMESTPQ